MINAIPVSSSKHLVIWVPSALLTTHARITSHNNYSTLKREPCFSTHVLFIFVPFSWSNNKKTKKNIVSGVWTKCLRSIGQSLSPEATALCNISVSGKHNEHPSVLDICGQQTIGVCRFRFFQSVSPEVEQLLNSQNEMENQPFPVCNVTVSIHGRWVFQLCNWKQPASKPLVWSLTNRQENPPPPTRGEYEAITETWQLDVRLYIWIIPRIVSG